MVASGQMTAKRLSIPSTISWLVGAIALWVSAGALTAIAPQTAALRVAITPSPWWLAALLAGAAILAAVRALPKPATWLLYLSAVLLLPWLPVRIPMAFLAWTGPMRSWIWVVIVVSIAACLIRQLATTHRAPFYPTLRSATNPRRAPWLAALVAALLYLSGAWLISPRLPAGDEPHYLVIAQSLLRDHDLKIENNHRRGDYREYFGGELRPDYLRRGADGEIYSIHPVGLPIIISPVFAAGGYAAVLAFLALVSAGATAVTWIVVWRLTQDVAASWFAWAAVSLSAPFFFQAFTVYPDAPGSALVMVALLSLLSDSDWSVRRLALTGLMLALLPWLHTRFVILEAALLILFLLKLMWRYRAAASDDASSHPAGVSAASHFLPSALALLAGPAIGAIAWFGFFYAIYGTPNPAAPYNGYTQSEVGNLVHGVPGLLFDQQFGLLPNAPVYLGAVLGLLVLLRRRLILGIGGLLLIVPYATAVAMYAMWWAGYSSPARFLVPISLPLAIPIGVWFSSLRSRSARLLACASLLLSVLITATMVAVERGALVFNVRDGSSRLLVWLSPLVDVTPGFPSLFRGEPRQALTDAAVWLAAIAILALVGRGLDRRWISAPAHAAVLGIAAVVASSVALSIVWRTTTARPIALATGGAALLRAYDPDSGQIAFRYSPFKRLTLTQVPQAITLVHTTPTERQPTEPLIWAPYLPAGTYEIEAGIAQPTSGRVTVTMDREFGPAWAWSLEGARGQWLQTFSVPVPARVLLIDADSSTRPALRDLAIRARSVAGSRHRLATEEAWHVVRYGPAVVFLMSGHAYVEPGGTWIGGGDEATFVIAPDPGTPISLFLRNAPIKNQLTLESGTWRQVLSLGPREERVVEVPIDPANAGARLRVATTSGARPSEFEQSDDTRLLGCWIETR